MRTAYDEGWMQTFSGKKFHLREPRIEDIDILDIAMALSNQCRYAGHCCAFYSVAEHCFHAAQAAPREHKLAALLHDASEAYLVDIPRPLKPLLGGYYEIENKLMHVIAEKYGFEWPMSDEVKSIDLALLRDEREQAMVTMDVPHEVWGDVMPGTGVKLQFWNPEVACSIFRGAFEVLKK